MLQLYRWVVPALVGVLLFSNLSAVRAQAEPKIDTNHTSAHFAAKHLLISTVQGFVPIKSIAATLGKDNVPTSVDALLDLTRIDTHNERRDNDLRSQRFLAVDQFPEMTFKSTKITPQGAGKFAMDGMLTIRGVTKPVTLEGNLVGSVKDDKGHMHVGYAATGTIDRMQWGIGSTIPAAVVGNDIQITIEAEVII